MTQCGMSRSEAIADPWDCALAIQASMARTAPTGPSAPVRIQGRKCRQVGQNLDLHISPGAAGIQVANPEGQQHDSVVAVSAQVLLEHDVNHQRGIGLPDSTGSQCRKTEPPQVVQCDGGHRAGLRRRTRPGVRP